jgi:hypothetical protein
MSKLLFNLLNVSFPGRTTAVRRPRRIIRFGRVVLEQNGSAYHHKNHDNERGDGNVMARAKGRLQNSCCWRSLSGLARLPLQQIFRTLLRNGASRSATRGIAQIHARMKRTSTPAGDSRLAMSRLFVEH